MRFLYALSFLGVSCLILSATGPVSDIPISRQWADGIDIALVVDISDSMEASDFSPNRMEVAKKVLKSFIQKRVYDRIGLVMFGGDAVTKSPLTRDYAFLESQIDDIRFRELKQGTAIGMGLLGGVSRLRNSSAKTKVLILMTDGDSNVGTVNPITAANLAHQENIKIYTIGIGQKDRVLIPIYSYDHLGKKGQLIAQIPSYLNPELLKRIATLTNGKSYMARDGNMLARFVSEIDRLERTPIKISQTKKIVPHFRIPLIMGALILLLVIILLELRFREVRIYAH